jgi:predicted dehydrogenase
MADKITRRTFLSSTSKAVIVGGMMAQGSVFGANDRVGVCVVGLNGRGKSHIEGFGNKSDSDVVAMCDVDARVLRRRTKTYETKLNRKPKAYRDMREAFDDKNVDAVSIATPNHWHSLAAIWAVQAGKDVYVEKPLSHNIFEGRQLANAVAQSDRIVQHGTQSRSDARWMRDIKLMHDGFLGDIHMAKGFTYKTGNRHSIGFADPQDAPDWLDWNMWQGPADEQRYCKNYVPYNWHWFWNYGNGETGNQGVHQMDLAVWGLNKGLPTKVYSAGGRYHWNDQGETPNTQITTFTYADGSTMDFEIRNYGSYPEAGSLTTGNTFWGEKGYYVEGQGFFTMDREPIPVPDGAELPETKGNWQNFIHACKTRDEADIRGTALDGHLSSAHCHIANTAYRLGRSLEFNPDKEQFKDADANALITRKYRGDFKVKKIAVT